MALAVPLTALVAHMFAAFAAFTGFALFAFVLAITLAVLAALSFHTLAELMLPVTVPLAALPENMFAALALDPYNVRRHRSGNCGDFHRQRWCAGQRKCGHSRH